MANRKINTYGLDFRRSFITKHEVREQLQVSSAFIKKYLPPPAKHRDPSRPGTKAVKGWDARELLQALNSPRFVRSYSTMLADRERSLQQVEEMRSSLRMFDIEALIDDARQLNRKFILHVGPTNSGKTYQAMQALRAAQTGVYLGPLRLLALEMFDTLNADGYPCSLLTGEEYEEREGARYTASTIEMCDFAARYDVAVIDEAQMVADRDRGSRWTNAIARVNAAEVHVCLAPQALDLIRGFVESFGAPCEVRIYERMTPLLFAGTMKDISAVEPGDALIAFSRRKVLNIAAALEDAGIRSSVIYGALPPEARREEIHKFASGVNNVVVATDAIGMGVSLPIKRVIFCFTDKYDGSKTRPLRPYEIKQIAGRAGRYGIYDTGEVLAMNNPDLIRDGMNSPDSKITRVTIPFPSQLVTEDCNLSMLMQEWEALPHVPGFRRESMAEPIALYRVIRRELKQADNETIYRCITCPFDSKSDELVQYWLEVCKSLTSGSKDLPMPPFGDDDLSACELQYSAYDMLHQMMRRFGHEPDFSRERSHLCHKINRFLTEDKQQFRMRCSRCGRTLPVTQEYGLCDRCYYGIYLSKYARTGADA